jgi:hypothetical protein
MDLNGKVSLSDGSLSPHSLMDQSHGSDATLPDRNAQSEVHSRQFKNARIPTLGNSSMTTEYHQGKQVLKERNDINHAPQHNSRGLEPTPGLKSSSPENKHQESTLVTLGKNRNSNFDQMDLIDYKPSDRRSRSGNIPDELSLESNANYLERTTASSNSCTEKIIGDSDQVFTNDDSSMIMGSKKVTLQSKSNGKSFPSFVDQISKEQRFLRSEGTGETAIERRLALPRKRSLRKSAFPMSESDKVFNTNNVDITTPKLVENDQNKYVFVETIEANMAKFTKREVANAEVARRLFSILGRPSLKDFIDMIHHNRLKNCPITVADVRRATSIWGPDLGAIVGRTTRKKPNSLPDEVFIRHNQETTTVYLDLFTISSLIFLLSISKGFNLLVIRYMDDKKANSADVAIREIIAAYARNNVKVSTIYCDGESGITALKTKIEQAGVALEQCSKNEHIATIERAGRQMKERVRSFANTLPFELTKEILIYLVYYLVSMINAFPRSTSAIEGVAPKTKVTGKTLDYLVDCKLEFGEYVQANEDNTNTNSMNARTFPAICLGPVGNAMGSYYFLNLETWEVVKRRSWVRLPLPRLYIDKINAKVKRETALYQNGGLRFRIGNTELPNDDDDDEDERSVAEVQNSIVNENQQVDYEPDYFHEEKDDEDIDNQPDYFHEEPYVSDEVSLSAFKQWLNQFAMTLYGHQVLTTYTPQKGIKLFGAEAIASMESEMTQLHQKGVMRPVNYGDLTPKQKVRILRSLMFLKRKRNNLLKSRFCANGSIQIRALAAIDPSSPTVSTEALFISAAIDAMEKRDKATVDVEGAYLHCKMVGEVFMRIDRVIADILLRIDPVYAKYRLPDGSIVVILEKALYGCIESARLFYENISKVLIDFGFVKNDYDPCVFNTTMYDKQCTVVIHVDDLKISCADSRGVDDVINELKRVYGNINVHREDTIDYLGMDFDYSTPGIVKISMTAMVDQVIEDMDVSETVRTPAAIDLFQVDEKSPRLDTEQAEKFHSIVAKLLYMAKRARPDILTAISFLTTRCTCSTNQDWNKLLRVAKYLCGTRELALSLTADSDSGIVINSYIDASFANHRDGKSHTGEMLTLGGGAVFSKSSKQKLVAKSSTEAELIGLSDGLSHVLWTKNFLQSQGYDTGPAIVHQDNKSTITLAEKGRSTSNRTRHISIRYFFVKDRIESGDVKVVHTGADKMTADFFSKPLQGHLFEVHRDQIMNNR